MPSVESNKGWFSLDSLKDYFDVTNTYVLRKLKLILLPFLSTQEDWSATSEPQYGENTSQGFTPRTNVQAPDLYIPLMAFVTFIIVSCFGQGLLEDT